MREETEQASPQWLTTASLGRRRKSNPQFRGSGGGKLRLVWGVQAGVRVDASWGGAGGRRQSHTGDLTWRAQGCPAVAEEAGSRGPTLSSYTCACFLPPQG